MAKSVLDNGMSPQAVAEMKKNGAKKLGAPKPKFVTKFDVSEEDKKEILEAGRKKKKAKKPDSAELEIRAYEALTVEEAMELIGWTIVEDGPFHLRDIHGKKILLKNNSTNRPFRIGLANRYKSEHLRHKWKLNGETIIFDWDGKCQSGQHRLAGFILAEEERREDRKVPGRTDGLGWKEACKLHWKHGGPLTLPCIIVKGIDPSPEVVDTLDLGQKRTMGDVFFREERFRGPAPFVGEDTPGKGGKRTTPTPQISEVIRRKLCNILSNATRLVWLRAGGKKVSDAPHFPHSEALDFIEANPRMEDMVLYIWGLEGGTGKGGCKISKFTSLGYAAGLCYLMSVSGTDPEEFKASREAALNFDMEKKAKEFWAKLASGAGLKENDPIHLVRENIRQIDTGSGMGRDEIVGMIIKAFNRWADGLKSELKDVVMPKTVDKETGKPKLAAEPRLGGMDVEGPERADELDIDKMDDTREGSMSGKMWSEGDTCWVRAEDGEHWFGTIKEVIKTSTGVEATVEDADTGRSWDEPLKNLWLKYPG